MMMFDFFPLNSCQPKNESTVLVSHYSNCSDTIDRNN